jgi:hypothetical protein
MKYEKPLVTGGFFVPKWGVFFFLKPLPLLNYLPVPYRFPSSVFFIGLP